VLPTETLVIETKDEHRNSASNDGKRRGRELSYVGKIDILVTHGRGKKLPEGAGEKHFHISQTQTQQGKVNSPALSEEKDFQENGSERLQIPK